MRPRGRLKDGTGYANDVVIRIFQEILTNVLRHSRSTGFHVRLREQGVYLELEVKDNGRGITEKEEENTRTLGLLGMKERALLVGGKVEITGVIEEGTTVVVRVPLADQGPSIYSHA